MAENMNKEKLNKIEQEEKEKAIKEVDLKLKKKHKKRFSIYSLLGKIGDVLLIPIMVVALISSISMLANRSQNKPTSIMGNYLVTIQSGSMKNDGFKIGDTVLTKKTKARNIQLGDVIAFYNYRDTSDPTIKDLELVAKYEIISGIGLDTSEKNTVIGTIDLNSIEYKKVERNKTVKDAQAAKTKINFHRVVGVYVDDENGTFYFRTKGSNNTSPDSFIIREDFVVGRYVNTPRTIRDVIRFCASTFGMIVLVCIPLSLQVLLQCLSLIEQIGILNNEKALLKGKASFKDDEFRKDFDGNQMELYNKVFYFFLIPKDDREFVKDCMWSNILYKEKPKKKETIILNTINISEQKLDVNEDGYWQDWIENTKGYDKHKITKQYQKLATENIFKKTKAVKGKPVKNNSAPKPAGQEVEMQSIFEQTNEKPKQTAQTSKEQKPTVKKPTIQKPTIKK